MISQQTALDSAFGYRSSAQEVVADVDLSGKTAVVTGGYSGIGTETVRALAGAGAKVIVAARRPEVAKENLADVEGSVSVVALDLGKPDSIDAFVQEVSEQNDEIHLLINNAAIMANPLTRDDRGYESQFATNHLGHFQLTAGLWPLSLIHIFLWDIYDFVRDCMSDMWLGLLPNSTQVTDWDEDGITETSLIYKLSCRSDVSPSDMKILIHENEVKMGLRGTMILEMDKANMGADFEPDASKIDLSDKPEIDQYMGLMGRYKNEDDFKDQPKVFLENARKLWMEFVDKDEFLQL